MDRTTSMRKIQRTWCFLCLGGFFFVLMVSVKVRELLLPTLGELVYKKEVYVKK
jgi:hypothetical protein